MLQNCNLYETAAHKMNLTKSRQPSEGKYRGFLVIMTREWSAADRAAATPAALPSTPICELSEEPEPLNFTSFETPRINFCTPSISVEIHINPEDFMNPSEGWHLKWQRDWWERSNGSGERTSLTGAFRFLIRASGFGLPLGRLLIDGSRSGAQPGSSLCPWSLPFISVWPLIAAWDKQCKGMTLGLYFWWPFSYFISSFIFYLSSLCTFNYCTEK